MELITGIYYVVSIMSIFLYVSSVQFKNKKDILSIQVLASICYLIVYVIKGAWSGVFIEVLEESKDIAFIEIEKKNKKIPLFALMIFLSLLVLVSIIFYDGVLSLLPMIINIILFVSTYFKNPKYIRWLMIVCGALWGVYNIYVGAYIIVIGNVLEILSAIVAIVKFREKK